MKRAKESKKTAAALSERTIALVGNPNVGKSTIFNALTGMNQHTGNWPGKTVGAAIGKCRKCSPPVMLVDLPGTYSLTPHSLEEEVTHDFICRGEFDAAVVVCDATCLERNLNLVLQVAEATDNVIVCVNLLDEAERKGIHIDLSRLSEELGLTVVGVSAKKRGSLAPLTDLLVGKTPISVPKRPPTVYPSPLEDAIQLITETLKNAMPQIRGARRLARELLCGNASVSEVIDNTADENTGIIMQALKSGSEMLRQAGISPADTAADATVKRAEEAARECVTYESEDYCSSDRKIDRILTGKLFGFPLMGILLVFVLWLTIAGANYPSELLSSFLSGLEDPLLEFFSYIHLPVFVSDALVFGVYRTLAWVISVMLPPMAIFFPLFTILEDVGYLPRIAYNLDKPFQKCHACGKQALTMCMGFGCNAVGVSGCRIIDSKRECLIAILTNNFVPCNGRFPAMISVILVFFAGAVSSAASSLISALILAAVIALGIIMTFGVSRLLSSTVLRGEPSSFTLELPPYRKPKIISIIVRSIFDRTLFVLGRAAAVAAPAGLIIWLISNMDIGGESILSYISEALDPIGRFMGLDGVILLAFILGMPANEIVIPIILMAYSSGTHLTEISGTEELSAVLAANGWSNVTAICVILFFLFHWPCSTTLITIKKETGSLRWTLIAFLIPTLIGFTVCSLIYHLSLLF